MPAGHSVDKLAVSYSIFAFQMAIVDVLLPSIRSQLSEAANDWFEEARGRAGRAVVPQFLRLYTEMSRHLGRTPLVLGPRAVDACPELRHTPLGHWFLEDAGRLLLLLTRYEAFPASSDDNTALAIECYEQGAAREQQSWLRTVALLPEPERFLLTVIDACRASIVPIFEAVACENMYPAKYFPERNFNQVVLKALFNGIALNRIVGLPARLNPELSRMARDYAAERRAAGRSIPADISLAIFDDVAAQRTEQ
jgi:hypothetical protein